MPDRLTSATINLSHYAHNISTIRELVPDTVTIMAVVKANAYGHGLEKIAETAVRAGVSYLGVASLGELKRIRGIGIKTPVLLLSYLDPASVSEAVQYDASITIMHEAIIPVIGEEARKQSKHVKIHIKIDTGMHRAGCDPATALNLAKKVESAPHLVLEGIFTHFAESEAPGSTFTHRQLQLFTDCIDLLRNNGCNPPLLHCANSAALINFPAAHFTMVRPGIVSYGLNPFPKSHPKYEFTAKRFKPVLSLGSQIVFIRDIEAGETVGYNRKWRAQRQSTIALLPVGYGDGYRRTAEDIAAAYGTIHYEVVTALSDRIVRNYTGPR